MSSAGRGCQLVLRTSKPASARGDAQNFGGCNSSPELCNNENEQYDLPEIRTVLVIGPVCMIRTYGVQKQKNPAARIFPHLK